MTPSPPSTRPLPRVAFASQGCKLNRHDQAVLEETLLALSGGGVEIVSPSDRADLYVVNTCTVTAESDRQNRKLVRSLLRRHPGARVVVTGCASTVAGEAFADLEGVVLVGTNAEKPALPETILRLLGVPGAAPAGGQTGGKVYPGGLASTLAGRAGRWVSRTRPFLSVEDGCDSGCTYCILPRARGSEIRSVPIPVVLDSLAILAGRGAKEVVLTGLNLGRYGVDLGLRRGLLDLLEAIEARAPVPRLRLSSLEPEAITPDLVAFVAGSGVVCPHLHVPLQSGDDRVLARMGRRYGTAAFGRVVETCAAAIADLGLGTDVIVGFPGEDDAAFDTTLAFLRTLPLSYLHVFPYSPRPGTAAADYADRPPATVARERAARLGALDASFRAAFAARHVGRRVEVLLETSGELPGEPAATSHGRARNYLPVRVEGPMQTGSGNLLAARVTGTSGGVAVAVPEGAGGKGVLTEGDRSR